jgi:glycyl-tRNA synthetase
MAEIEHFVDPTNKKHHKFYKLKDAKLPLFSAENQMTNERAIITDLSLEDAVS